MITDMCTRIWQGEDPLTRPEADTPAQATPERHQQAMHCVDLAVVLGYRSGRIGIDLPNERIAAFVQGDPVKRLGFAGIDLASRCVDDDLAAARESGFAGITIAPADQGVRPTDDRCIHVLEWCAENRLPLILSNPGLERSESVLEFARPSLLDESLARIDGLHIVFGDIGRCFLDEALAVIAKHERAMAEISTVVRREWMLRQALLEAWDRGVIDKLVFGSGFPCQIPERAIARVYGVSTPAGAMPNVPRPLLRRLIERDALDLLGIEQGPAPRRPEVAVTRASHAVEVMRAS